MSEAFAIDLVLMFIDIIGVIFLTIVLIYFAIHFFRRVTGI